MGEFFGSVIQTTAIVFFALVLGAILRKMLEE